MMVVFRLVLVISSFWVVICIAFTRTSTITKLDRFKSCYYANRHYGTGMWTCHNIQAAAHVVEKCKHR